LGSCDKFIQALEFAELIKNGDTVTNAHRKVYNNDNCFISENVS
ncbi:unnamed protein product, partial [marine sediment metagenome]